MGKADVNVNIWLNEKKRFADLFNGVLYICGNNEWSVRNRQEELENLWNILRQQNIYPDLERTTG